LNIQKGKPKVIIRRETDNTMDETTSNGSHNTTQKIRQENPISICGRNPGGFR